MRVDDVVALMRAHRLRDDERFRQVALSIAANERKEGEASRKLLAAARALDDRPAELPPKVAGMVRAPAEGGAPVLTADLKGRVGRIVDEHKAGDTIRSAGLRPVGSVMFVGPPGVGKTMTAGWIGSQIGLPTYVVRSEALIASVVGAIKVDFTPPEAAAYREHNHRQIVRDLHRLAKEHLLAGEVA